MRKRGFCWGPPVVVAWLYPLRRRHHFTKKNRGNTTSTSSLLTLLGGKLDFVVQIPNFQSSSAAAVPNQPVRSPSVQMRFPPKLIFFPTWERWLAEGLNFWVYTRQGEIIPNRNLQTYLLGFTFLFERTDSHTTRTKTTMGNFHVFLLKVEVLAVLLGFGCKESGNIPWVPKKNTKSCSLCSHSLSTPPSSCLNIRIQCEHTGKVPSSSLAQTVELLKTSSNQKQGRQDAGSPPPSDKDF